MLMANLIVNANQLLALLIEELLNFLFFKVSLNSIELHYV